MEGHRRNLARWIREIRENLGLTQEELGARMDPKVSGATVSRWESGQHVPTEEHLRGLARLSGDTEFSVRRILQNQEESQVRARVEEAVARLGLHSGEEIKIGPHTVVLEPDDSLLVNGSVRIRP